MISDKVNNKDKETMIDIQKNLQTIKNRIEKTAIKFKRDPSEIKLIVVTKKFTFEKIKPLIRIMEFLLLIIFITHIYNSILLTVNSKKSRSTDYEKFSNKSSSIYSRTMFLSGSILLIFIITHLSTIWFNFQNIDDHDIYYYFVTESIYGFGNIFITILYLVSMFLLGFHLRHGFQSAFKTLGVENSKFEKLINAVSVLFWFFIPLGFFSIAFWFGILDGGKWLH